ncbi:zinc-ribbon domain-containing protein [Rathayibacter sp. KR2-224]|uniref:zinc-ribbon domain-containing protein n=1 Tax=Rathayibacter sp. KR2-224 TaxID=3400913 RepID=UPI003BFC0B09
MAEPVDQWWARRQFSRGTDVPYPVGTYREAWASFPALIRQYHPDLNQGFTLSQIPPAAEVLLQWQCEAGHIFVATPAEQRERPGQRRRRSAWCPECTRLALSRPNPRLSVVEDGPRPARPPRPARRICDKTPALPVGTAFLSVCAPKPASAVEAELRAGLESRLAFTAGLNAIRIGRPFFDHLEVWPDILLPELQVAVEYDSTGRHGLEHVGKRQRVDERKDRAVRSTGWEVVRIRTGRLPALGPHDIVASGLTKKTYERIIDELREIRGQLFVDAYLR